jgi:hypothetical protein
MSALTATPAIWQINEMLTALIRERDAAETPEEKTASDEALKLFVQAEVLSKPDIFISYLKHCQSHAEIADKEANRIAGIARRWLRRAEGLQNLILAVMNEAKQKEIEGDTGSFKVAANPPSVEITNPALILEELCQYTGSVSGGLMYHIREVLAPFPVTFEAIFHGLERTPSKALIAAEMRKPCQNCKGTGLEPYIDMHECEECDGSGKKKVAGARWISDKTRLSVK